MRTAPPTVLYLDLNTDWRGGQRQILWMGEGLRRQGGRPIFALRPHAVLAERARAHGIEVVPVDPLIAEWGPWTVARLRRIIRREHVDVVHPQCGHSMALAALATLGLRVPVVFARRVTFPLRRNPGTRLKYGRATHFIAVCEAAARGLLEAGIDPARIDVVYSGVELDRCPARATLETLTALGIPADAVLAVQVGALTAMKDPLTFVRAVAAARRTVPRLHGLLVGDGPLRADIESLARKLGIADALHLAGFRTDPESFMLAADVVVLSSGAVGEGIGGVVLDALALGRPVAATATGGIPEVVQHERTGLLSPVGDAEALGANIARLIVDRAFAARVVADGSARIADFAIERTVERTMAVYERLRADDAPPASDADRPLTVLELDTERGWRGGERQLLWQAERLAERGHRVLVAARPDQPLAERARAAGLPVIPCQPRFEMDPLAALALRRAIEREDVDVVHAHTAHGVALGALATRHTRAKLVITRHSDFHLRRNAGTRWKYARVDGLIAISSAARRAMIASGLPASRIEVIPGGADQRRTIVPADACTLAALGVACGAPLIVQVSQLVSHKDPLTFVRAIAAARACVPALHAVLVGDGPLRTEVERAVAEHELGDVLHVAGYRQDADALLAAADVVTLSSTEDALPSVLFDALHLGKPIVATLAGGIPEIVEHGRSGVLVPVGDARALGDAIARVLTDPAHARSLAAGAMSRAPEFTIDRSVDRTLGMYHRLLGGRVRA